MADRSRRRCVLRKAAVPDATHYVGYVEDEETPEMIMKKFEEMERIKAASKRAGEQSDSAGPSSSAAAGPAAACSEQQPGSGPIDEEAPLDQQQLQEIFKATSMYNVKSLLGNNEALMVDAAQRHQPDRGAASDFGLDSGQLLQHHRAAACMLAVAVACMLCGPSAEIHTLCLLKCTGYSTVQYVNTASKNSVLLCTCACTRL